MFSCFLKVNRPKFERLFSQFKRINEFRPSRNASSDFDELKTSIDKLPDVYFTALKIGAGGCSVGRPNYNSFTNGNIDLELFSPIGKNHVAVSTKMTTLYRDSIAQIKDSLISQDSKLEGAVRTLLNYLNNIGFHESCINEGIYRACNTAKIKPEFYIRSQNTKLPETKIATLLAVHLLSKLTADGNGCLTYVVSDDDDYSQKPDVCPCGCKDCGEKLPYASTLIGSVDLFIGVPDIVLFPYNKDRMVGIVYPHQDAVMNKEELNQFVEVKKNQGLLEKWATFEQVALQTITFSFYHRIFMEMQNEISRDHSSTSSLIPTIAICDKGFSVCMYDSVNDVFLHNHGPPIPLFDITGECLRKSSVIYLWMIINHSLLQPMFTERYVSKMQGSFGLLSRFVNDDFYGRIKESMGMNIEIVTENKLKNWRNSKLIDPDDPNVDF